MFFRFLFFRSDHFFSAQTPVGWLVGSSVGSFVRSFVRSPSFFFRSAGGAFSAQIAGFFSCSDLRASIKENKGKLKEN